MEYLNMFVNFEKIFTQLVCWHTRKEFSYFYRNQFRRGALAGHFRPELVCASVSAIL